MDGKIGNDEVGSSILPHSTISHFFDDSPPNTLKGKAVFGVPYTPSGVNDSGSEKASLSTV